MLLINIGMGLICTPDCFGYASFLSDALSNLIVSARFVGAEFNSKEENTSGQQVESRRSNPFNWLCFIRF